MTNNPSTVIKWILIVMLVAIVLTVVFKTVGGAGHDVAMSISWKTPWTQATLGDVAIVGAILIVLNRLMKG